MTQIARGLQSHYSKTAAKMITKRTWVNRQATQHEYSAFLFYSNYLFCSNPQPSHL